MYSELKTAIVTRLRNDAALADLLSSPNAIYYRSPPQPLVLPCLCYHINDAPDPACSSAGRVRLSLVLSIRSTSGDANDAILAALDAVLFDAHREGGLDTDSWRVALCRRTESAVVDEDLDDGQGNPVEHRRTLWRLEVMQR